MSKIDSHQHFWKYNKKDYGWISSSMPELKADFLPEHLKSEFQKVGIDGCIAVQARQSEEETEFLLGLANENNFIKGVVGWVDLKSPDVSERLAHFASHPKFVGVRHVVQDEPDEKFLLHQDFLRGISALAPYELCYDILVFPKQLKTTLEFVAKFPDQKFVLDHIGKPFIKDNILIPWADDIYELAKNPNVFCKLSGMVTEAKLKKWKYEDFVPFIEVIFDAFGLNRIMYGSDWPVCKLSGEYADVFNMINTFMKDFLEIDQRKIFGTNALKFYNII